MLEPQCKVTLMHHTPLYIGAHGARTCWDSGDKSDTCLHEHVSKRDNMIIGEYYLCDDCDTQSDTPYIDTIICGSKDAELLDRVGNKFKHASILEHLSYNFFITDVSRALLQELARHRMASYSVKSTRYTLKELKEEDTIALLDLNVSLENTYNLCNLPGFSVASKYLVLTGVEIVDMNSYSSLRSLQIALKAGISNDVAKYCLPESYKTSIQWTINARSLQNFLSLRSDKSALWEIRQLSQAVYNAIPDDHQYLFADHIKSEQ